MCENTVVRVLRVNDIEPGSILHVKPIDSQYVNENVNVGLSMFNAYLRNTLAPEEYNSISEIHLEVTAFVVMAKPTRINVCPLPIPPQDVEPDDTDDFEELSPALRASIVADARLAVERRRAKLEAAQAELKAAEDTATSLTERQERLKQEDAAVATPIGENNG